MFIRGFFCITLIILASGCGGGAGGGAVDTPSNNNASSSSSSSVSSTSSSSSSSSSASVEDPGTAPAAVILQWQRPEQRENGEYLEADEIGGYELRYKKLNSDEFNYLVVEDGWRESFEFQQELIGAYEFQIAAFDTNGLYSEFVSLQAF